MSFIPKKIFTYWEGDQLSILHYYTILSLVKLNPTIEVIIYTSDHTSSTFVTWNTPEHSIHITNTISLLEIVAISSRIVLHPISFEKEYGISNQLSVIHKADFIRIVKLYEHGGLWFDFDILFIKPIPSYLFESYVELYYFSYEDTVATGLLLSTPKNTYITELYNKVIILIHNVTAYQAIGPDLWKECVYNKFLKSAVCLSTSMVYPYICINYPLFFESQEDLVQNNTFCIHWYNGGSVAKNFINSFDNKNINPTVSVCHKYIHKINEL